jgi:ubiquinone/menaquinone biosynthesis C-methylase UbiE
MRIYQKFLDGVPDYLARHYWWAYLWSWSIWFFDHQPIINAILFGQYDKLLKTTLAHIERKPGARLLQLTCVYGKLTPELCAATDNEVHLCDAATGQLELAKRKTKAVADRCFLARMNAECLGYGDNAFDQVILFFLFHEMPDSARQNVYSEISRVIRPGGSILVTEYAALPNHHLFYRFLPFRWLIGHLEPFLPGFWQEDVNAKLSSAMNECGKELDGEPVVAYCFNRFYRVMRFNVTSDLNKPR